MARNYLRRTPDISFWICGVAPKMSVKTLEHWHLSGINRTDSDQWYTSNITCMNRVDQSHHSKFFPPTDRPSIHPTIGTHRSSLPELKNIQIKRYLSLWILTCTHRGGWRDDMWLNHEVGVFSVEWCPTIPPEQWTLTYGIEIVSTLKNNPYNW